MKNLVFVAALVLCLSTAVWAQSNEARVVDLSGNGVAGVTVECKAGCQPTAARPAIITISTSTDADGRFSWPTPQLGGGSGCQFSTGYSYTLKKEGFSFTRTTFEYRPFGPPSPQQGVDTRIPLIQATDLPAWVNVSAASFILNQMITNEMIVAGFGADLARTVETATLPLPTVLGGRRVLVKDFAGTEKAAKLLFVSPEQINYVTPEGLSDGPAVLRVLDESGNLIRTGLAELRKVFPSIFTANADGLGAPASIITRVRPGNLQSFELVAQFDPIAGRFVPSEIDLGPEEEVVVLSLFGTGVRQVGALSEVSVIAVKDNFSVRCPVEYAGKQPTFDGFDQINARLPRELIGQGEIRLLVSVSGVSANAVQLKFK